MYLSLRVWQTDIAIKENSVTRLWNRDAWRKLSVGGKLSTSVFWFQDAIIFPVTS